MGRNAVFGRANFDPIRVSFAMQSAIRDDDDF